MGDILHLLAILLASFRVVQGIPWRGPTQTIESDNFAYLGWNPKPTEAPIAYLSERDITVPPNVCGWVDGNSNSEWTVDIATDTCYFYSDIKIVNGWTACVDYGQTYTAECGSDCSLVNYCGISSPYCGTVIFPSGYSAHGNCDIVSGLTYNIELTYTGQSELIDFPIYTGSNGISTGTQYPPGYVVTATSSVISSSASFSLSLSSSPSTSTSTPISTPASAPASVPAGAIAGGVVGGVVVIGIVAIGIAYILRRKRSSPGTTSNQVQPTMLMTPPKQEHQPPEFQQSPQELEHPMYLSELEQPPPPQHVFQPPYPAHPGKAELDASVGTPL